MKRRQSCVSFVLNKFVDVLSFQKNYGLERNSDPVDPVLTEIAQGSSRSSMGLSDIVRGKSMEPSTTMSGTYLKDVAIKFIVSSKHNWIM